MATKATWQRTDAMMTMEHYRAMYVRYRDDTATHMQWISRMKPQPVELFADAYSHKLPRSMTSFQIQQMVNYGDLLDIYLRNSIRIRYQ